MIKYDYGLKPSVMIVGDIQFQEYWSKARLRGIGYINIPKSSLETKPLEIVMIFNNFKYGKKVMQSFHNWIDNSDGNSDALGIDIIDKGDEGYVLCFYQDMECLIQRTLPKGTQKWVEPIITSLTTYKTIDHVSEYYESFKKLLKYCDCHIYGGTVNNIFNDFPPIIKKRINVYSEKDLTDNDKTENVALAGYYGITKAQIQKEEKKKKGIISEDLDNIRLEVIKYFYPLTYEKVTRRGFLNDIINELKKTYTKGQILQAICNLTLQHRIERDEHVEYTDGWDTLNILNYMVNNHESPRSYFPDKAELSKECILDQINLDLELIKTFNEEE